MYISYEILFSHRKRNLAFVTPWIDLESIVLSEMSQRKTNTV